MFSTHLRPKARARYTNADDLAVIEETHPCRMMWHSSGWVCFTCEHAGSTEAEALEHAQRAKENCD